MDDESDQVSSRGSFTDEYHHECHDDPDFKGFSQTNSNTSRILPQKKLHAIPETTSDDDSDKIVEISSGKKKEGEIQLEGKQEKALLDLEKNLLALSQDQRQYQ
jgi:hypothetical protein